jgi:hypothetical protein
MAEIMHFEYLQLFVLYRGVASSKIWIISTNQQTLQSILSEIRKILPDGIPGRFNIEEQKDISGQLTSYSLSNFNAKYPEIIYWILRWLCNQGWEPFAHNASINGSGIESPESFHFRMQT